MAAPITPDVSPIITPVVTDPPKAVSIDMGKLPDGRPRTFAAAFGLTQADADAHVAQALMGREAEVYHYEVNARNYEAMLAMLDARLPKEWPAALEQYKGQSRDTLVRTVPDADLDTVILLVFRDELRLRLRTERVEQLKARLVMDALATQRPGG